MGTTVKSKKGLKMPFWGPLSQPIMSAQSALSSGVPVFAEDLRNNGYAHPIVYFNMSASLLMGYNKVNNAFFQVTDNFGGAGSFSTGSFGVIIPSLSPSGLLATGCTTKKIVLSTALPASVGVDQMSNRGDGKGFIVRITGKRSGGSGKTEERRCIHNTSGTTPTIELNEELSFTPDAGDGYEFLSGSYVAMGTGASATSNIVRRYDFLTGALSSLSTTNLITTIPATGNALIPTESGYVPWDRNTSEGKIVGASTYDDDNTICGGPKKCLLASAIAAGTITGQVNDGDSGATVHQFRNAQVRIVEDTVNVTAVGQVRPIQSHTVGTPGATAPIYTLASNWTVTPSANCKFVIEENTNNVIGLFGGTTTVYNYSISGNTWDTSTWAVKGNTSQVAGAFAFHSFGIKPNLLNTAKSSNIFLFRGATKVFDLLNTAGDPTVGGASTGQWTQGLTMLDWTGTGLDTIVSNDTQCVAYNPHTECGKYLYLCPGSGTTTTSSQRSFIRFDASSFKVEKFAGPMMISGGSALGGVRYAFMHLYQDDFDEDDPTAVQTKIGIYITGRPLGGTDFWRVFLFD